MKKLSFHLTTISLLWLLISGCNTYKRQQQNAEKFYNQYPNELAALCALKFPVKESDSIRVDSSRHTVNRDYTALIDSLSMAANAAARKAESDSLTLEAANKLLIAQASEIDGLRVAYHPCKADTVYISHIITKVNTAQADSIQVVNVKMGVQATQQQTQLDALKHAKAVLVGWVIGLALLAALLLAGLVYLVFFKKLV